MRILLISDPHFDFDPRGVRSTVLSALERQDYDTIACAGDIANGETHCAEFLSWFSDIKVPKFLVPGNHDLWWTRRPHTSRLGTPRDGFNGHADRNGWRTPDPTLPWQVIDKVLLFSVFYTTNPAWNQFPLHAYMHGAGGNDLTYSQDHRNIFRFDDLVTEPPVVDGETVAWSMSHLCPSDQIRSKYAPQVCYVNNRLLEVARSHGSRLHLFGHTHEEADQVIGGIRCVSRPWMNDEYRLNGLDSRAVIHV